MKKPPYSPKYICLICDDMKGYTDRTFISHFQLKHYRIYKKIILAYTEKLPYFSKLIAGIA